MRKRPTIWSWLPLAVLPTGVIVGVPADWPRWLMMWLLAFAIYCGCKWLTFHATERKDVKRWRQAAYLLAWPGLDAPAFLGQTVPPDERPKEIEWISAITRMILGGLCVWILARQVPVEQSYWRGWVGMVGIVLLLHFGLFDLLSCVWRTVGVQARPLMDSPVRACSLSDFWGNRWNTAFRDLTHRFLFQPLAKWLGPRWAVSGGFVFSGVVHDVVISVPAGGGYGGPTAYFVIQGIGVAVSRSLWARRWNLRSGFSGWLFTASVLLIPVGLLFHVPFVERVIVPFLHALKAI